MRPYTPLVVLLTLLPAQAWAVAPDGADLPVEPPQQAYARSASRQASLSQLPALDAFSQRWGGSWQWRFDEATGRPLSARLGDVDLADAETVAAELSWLLDGAELDSPDRHDRGDRSVRAWQQVHDGLPLFGAELAVFAQQGRVHFVRTTLATPPRQRAPSGATLWWPLGKGVWAPATRSEALDVVAITHVDGTVLARWTTRHATNVEYTWEPRKTGDATTSGPLVGVTITDETGSQLTDSTGTHTASDPYTLRMEGERTLLRDAFRSGSPVPELTGLEGDQTLVLGTDLDPATADVWAHLAEVQAWLEGRESDHPILDEQVVATVNRSDVRCNAYYTSGTVNFGRPSGSCANTGRLADVIYHEFGHGVHHYGLEAGGFAGDLSEGTADYIAATILDDPRIGLGFFGGETILRDIEPDRVYPTDFRGQVHNDGRIWSSFLWNLRDQWQQAYGDDVGAEMTDQLMLRTMATGPSMTTVGDAVIVADDDNGDLADGTPHGCELKTLLDQHGLGPGALGVVLIEHEPLDHVGSYETSYPVDFQVLDATPGCSGLDRSSVALWWTTDSLTPDDTADGFALVEEGSEVDASTVTTFTSAGGATWQRLDVSEADTVWSGSFPRQLATTQVHYFIEARSVDGTVRLTTHDGRLDGVFTFTVGDRERVWCEGFEGDTAAWQSGPGTPWEDPASTWEDQWTVGAPAGGLWSPSEAFEGGRIMATNLDGLYRNLNVQYLSSPPLTVPDEGRMRRLSWRRWLSVEDALYDKARIYVDDERVWEQPGTSGGGDHTVDTRWVLQELPVDDRAGQDVVLTWTLRSDPGLEFGGWALDDVCVTRLADLPGHHRVRDLTVVAGDARAGVAMYWTNPWIAPLDELVIVRTRGGLPVSRDALWVHTVPAPPPGQPLTFIDTEVEPCTPYGYAVFLKGDGVWYEGVVDGENASMGTTYCPDPEETELPEPVDPTPAGPRGAVDGWSMPEIQGCGCATSGSAAGWLPVLLLLPILRRRRRSLRRGQGE